MPDENINQPKSSTGDQPSEEPKTTPETPPSGPSERVPPGSEPTPEITPTEPTEPELPETPTPSTPAPEPSTPTPPADKPPPTTIVSAPPEKKSRLKLIAGVVILILLLASIPAAVYLVQQRQEIRERAVGCDRDCSATRSNIECWSWAGSGCAWQGDPYSGSCICTREETPTPTPPAPPPKCGGTNASCQVDDDCCSKVCHFAKCAASCEGFDEPTCWTHANCHWESGSCRNGPLPSPPPGDCQIDCNAGRNGVSVTAKSGYADKCAGAVVSATWFASTCSGDSCFCYGPSKSEQGSLPFNRGMAGGGCGSWQAEITATTNKGGSCGASDHGCEYCEEPTPTPSYEAQCVQVQVLRGGVVINPSEITLGDSLVFRGFGATGDPTDSIDKIEFTVKKDGAVHTGPSEVAATKVGANWQADFPFTVSEVGSYNVIIRSHSLKYGWKD